MATAASEVYVRGVGQFPVVKLRCEDDGSRCGPSLATGMTGKLHYHALGNGDLAGPFRNVDGLSYGICPSQRESVAADFADDEPGDDHG